MSEHDEQDAERPNINSRLEEQIAEEAQKAFASIPDQHKPHARAARNQLFNWLTQLEAVVQDPKLVVTDEMANHVANAFEQATTKAGAVGAGGATGWGKMLRAWRMLKDDDQLNLIRWLLCAFVGRYAQGAMAVSRSNDVLFWDHTGFFVDGGIRAVFAKAGNRPYQPIGYDDDTHFIGTEGSQSLWVRQWGMALVLPWAPPFKVEKHELEEMGVEEGTTAEVTDRERAKIVDEMEAFEQFLFDYAKAGDDQPMKDGLEDGFREVTLRLARARLPRLDRVFESQFDAHPEHGPDLENVEVQQLAAVCLEFFRATLDSDDVRREQEAHTLFVQDERAGRRQLVRHALERLSPLIPPEGADGDGEAMKEALDQLRLAMPDMSAELSRMREAMPETTVLEAVQAMMLWLQKELDELSPAPAETGGEEATDDQGSREDGDDLEDADGRGDDEAG